jgi:addiction module RelE/StbE family toxin
MTIRWSPEAADDFARLIEFIRDENPSAAKKTARRIYNGIADLGTFPNRGRTGRVPRTRELALTPLPFVVVYTVKEDAVEIARILHGSQRWP